MLSNCANPECSSKFRYLHEGKLFFLPLSDVGHDGEQAMESFWVCSECCRLYTVAVRNGRVCVTPVRLVPSLPAWQEPQALAA